jgi:type I restriction enzyme S subunit
VINELAPGWAEEKLGKLNEKLVDGSHNPPPRHQGGLPMLSAKNVSNGGIEFGGGRLIAPEPFENENRRTRVQAGDVLLTIVGSIGRSAIVPKEHQTFTLQRSVAVISPLGVSPHFLSYQFRSHRCQQYFVDFARGTAQKGIYLGALVEMPILVPPTKEQERIVSRVDELFSGIEDGERALERVRKLVERYRQSVLKAAVTGELTREWRRKRAGELESGEALLTRILEARRKDWEKSELDAMKAQGKRPANDSWKKKFLEPAIPDATRLPELPAGWIWASIGQIGEISGGLTKNQRRTGQALTRPYLRVANVYTNRLDLEEVHRIGVSESELKRLTLKKNDLLVVEGNGSVGQIGRVALWDGSISDCIHQNHIIKVRMKNDLLAWYALIWCMSPGGRAAIEDVASSTAGLHTLSLSKIASLPIPLPTTQELHLIRDEFDRMDSLVAAQRVQVSTTSRMVASLRQGVLKRAFAGELIPQDPTDEPASVLLERIAAERSASPKSIGAKSVRKKKVKA